MDLLFALEILRLILLPSTLWKVFLFWSTIYQGLKNYPYIYWHINVRKCTIWRQSQTSVCRENSCFANNVGGICTNGKQSDAMPPGYVETNVTSPCNVIPQVCIYIQSTCTLTCAVLWSKIASFLVQLAFSLLKPHSCNTFRVEKNKKKKKEVCIICEVA